MTTHGFKTWNHLWKLITVNDLRSSKAKYIFEILPDSAFFCFIQLKKYGKLVHVGSNFHVRFDNFHLINGPVTFDR